MNKNRWIVFLLVASLGSGPAACSKKEIAEHEKEDIEVFSSQKYVPIPSPASMPATLPAPLPTQPPSPESRVSETTPSSNPTPPVTSAPATW